MNMEESTGLMKILFAGVLLALIIVIAIIQRRRTLKEQKDLPDDIPADTELLYVTHNGFTLPVRGGDEKTAWELMSKPERSKQVNKTRNALRDGKIIAIPYMGSYALAPREVAIRNNLDRVPVKGVVYKESWPPKK